MPNLDHQTYSKKNFQVAIFTYIILCILGTVFYKERVAFADLSFHMFYLIKNQDYIIQNQRFGAFITQSIPLIGSKLNLSLESISIAYSLGFALYYFSIFLIVYKLLKNQRMALVMLLLSTLMVCDTFFWIQSELPQGLAMMVLAFGIITHKPDIKEYTKLELVLLIPIIVTVAYFHPLIFIPFTFICLFLLLSANEYQLDKKLISFGLACFWVTYLLKNTLLKVESSYESGAKSGLENFITLFPNYLINRGTGQFIMYIISPGLLVLFIGMNALYIYQKKYLKIGLFNAFFVGYLLLISVTYNYAHFHIYYMENLYLPLVVIVGTVFVFDGLPKLNHYTQVVLLSSICIFTIIDIASTRVIYLNRQNKQRQIMQETSKLPQKKLLIDANLLHQETFLTTFGMTPYEFWLLSSIETPDDVRSIILTPHPSNIDYIQYYYNKSFISQWGVFDYDKLDNQYFNFTDTTNYVYYRPTNN